MAVTIQSNKKKKKRKKERDWLAGCLLIKLTRTVVDIDVEVVVVVMVMIYVQDVPLDSLYTCLRYSTGGLKFVRDLVVCIAVSAYQPRIRQLGPGACLIITLSSSASSRRRSNYNLLVLVQPNILHISHTCLQ